VVKARLHRADRDVEGRSDFGRREVSKVAQHDDSSMLSRELNEGPAELVGSSHLSTRVWDGWRVQGEEGDLGRTPATPS
jgi:hypothetical protein